MCCVIVGELEDQVDALLEEETPLSLLEDCYTAVFSVARYYTQNNIEPTRLVASSALNTQHATTTTTKNIEMTTEVTSAAAPSNNNAEPSAASIPATPSSLFFSIGNSECYRILSECLDMMQLMCKYYIDISRYRDATSYIREALDVTQLNFATRRITTFLLHHVNVDLIAQCLNEATSRIKIAEHLGEHRLTLDKMLQLFKQSRANAPAAATMYFSFWNLQF